MKFYFNAKVQQSLYEDIKSMLRKGCLFLRVSRKLFTQKYKRLFSSGVLQLLNFD